jgi:hypothetical protein
MPKKARDVVEKGFRDRTEGKNNWFKTVVLREGAKFHRTTFSMSDIEMSEQTEQQVRQVARVFNLPPSRLGLSDSVSYNSRAEDNQGYLDSTLSPYLVAIQQECTRKLLSKNEQKKHFFEVVSDQLLKLNPLDRAQVWAIYQRNGIVSAQVVQEAEGFPVVEVKPTDTGGANEGQFDNDSRKLVYSVGERARHKVKNPAAFREWVAGDLKYHREQARTLGISERIIDEIAEELRGLSENHTPNTIANAVSKTMEAFELSS